MSQEQREHEEEEEESFLREGTEEVTLRMAEVDLAREQFENVTFSGLFLSGKVSALLDDDFAQKEPEEEEEEWDDVDLQYFPDPPFVRAPDGESDEDPLDGQRPKPIEYWKEHAHYYDVWPSIKENRDANQEICRVFAGTGGGRTSSVLNRRIVVNVSPHQLGLRSRPSLDEESKTGEVVKPGRAVVVNSCMTQDGTNWWKLREVEAYVFESKEGTRVMQEAMNVEAGKWWYRVTCRDCIEVRSAPSYGDELRTGWILSPGTLVLCCLRCRIGSSQWLLLEDGRGWIFLWKPVLAKSGGMKAGADIALEESHTEIIDQGDEHEMRRAIPPTDAVVEVGRWNYVVQKRPLLCIGARQHGAFLSPGDIVKVDKRCSANGCLHQTPALQERLWLRLADGRGWVPVHGDDGKEQIVLQDPDDLTYPGWYLGVKDYDTPAHEWMVDFV